jgi:beta-glucosidase
MFRPRYYGQKLLHDFRAALWVVFAFCSSSALQAQATEGPVLQSCAVATCPFMDRALPVAERASDLISRMTTAEVVSQLMNQAAAIPRLGIPDYEWWSEALHGVARNGIATNFPQSIGLAATFDTDLMRKVADVVASEGRAKYNEAQIAHDHRRFAGLTFWSPNVNIFRDPRWGRGQETFGEDPYLSARMGVEFVRGLEGDDPHYLKLVATPKHYAVHSGPERDRHHFNVSVTAHDLEDTYLPAFRASIVEAHAHSIMCAYNAVDGTPACANDLLLNETLRRDWGFQGYIVSDCDAVGDITSGHKYTADNLHGAAASLKAGTDLDCGSTYKALVQSVKAGLVSRADLDRAAVRLFTARFQLGMFDPPEAVPYSHLSASDVDTTASRALALQAARESIVLLKNNGVLPLHKPGKIAVIGPTADLLEAIEGNYNGEAAAPASPLAGFTQHFGRDHVVYQPGSVLAEGTEAPIPSMYLRPSPGSVAHGLTAEFFADAEFHGEPVATRVDEKINFDWNRVAPAPGVPVGHVAVRWTGELLPPAAGDYVLSFHCMKRSTVFDPTASSSGSAIRYRFYLDGTLILTNQVRDQGYKVSFPDTKPHQLRIEYDHVSEDRFVDLEWQPPAEPLVVAAVRAAQAADVVVAFVGLSPNLEGEEMPVYAAGFEGGDRTNIDLPAVQQRLLEALKATGKPLIVVLTAGSPVALTWVQEHADAILAAWYPGQAGGTAIADTVAGLNNPAGRLPVTFYRSTGDLPAFSDYSMTHRTYRYFDGPVLYPFGYGLSYSRFSYTRPAVEHSAVRAGETVRVKIQVTNISALAGDEVCELYVTPPASPLSPIRMLEGFSRVHLAPGEKREISFALDPRQLSTVDSAGRRAEVSGDYLIWIGGSQPTRGKNNSIRLRVEGRTDLPR